MWSQRRHEEPLTEIKDTLFTTVTDRWRRPLMGCRVINSITAFQKLNLLSHFRFGGKAALDYWWERRAFVKQMKQRHHAAMSRTRLTKPPHELHISRVLVTTME